MPKHILDIVDEEVATLRREWETDDRLDSQSIAVRESLNLFEERLKNRVNKECQEAEVPKCQVRGCDRDAVYEGWTRQKDPLTGQYTGLNYITQTCDQDHHDEVLIGRQIKCSWCTGKLADGAFWVQEPYSGAPTEKKDLCNDCAENLSEDGYTVRPYKEEPEPKSGEGPPDNDIPF
jgi:hypothetical protein